MFENNEENLNNIYKENFEKDLLKRKLECNKLKKITSLKIKNSVNSISTLRKKNNLYVENEENISTKNFKKENKKIPLFHSYNEILNKISQKNITKQSIISTVNSSNFSNIIKDKNLYHVLSSPKNIIFMNKSINNLEDKIENKKISNIFIINNQDKKTENFKVNSPLKIKENLISSNFDSEKINNLINLEIKISKDPSKKTVYPYFDKDLNKKLKDLKNEKIISGISDIKPELNEINISPTNLKIMKSKRIILKKDFIKIQDESYNKIPDDNLSNINFSKYLKKNEKSLISKILIEKNQAIKKKLDFANIKIQDKNFYIQVENKFVNDFSNDEIKENNISSDKKYLNKSKPSNIFENYKNQPNKFFSYTNRKSNTKIKFNFSNKNISQNIQSQDFININDTSKNISKKILELNNFDLKINKTYLNHTDKENKIISKPKRSNKDFYPVKDIEKKIPKIKKEESYLELRSNKMKTNFSKENFDEKKDNSSNHNDKIKLKVVKNKIKSSDLIKRNISKICVDQININQTILKPMILQEIRHDEIKFFKKVFKSNDEHICVAMNDYIYKNLKSSYTNLENQRVEGK